MLFNNSSPCPEPRKNHILVERVDFDKPKDISKRNSSGLKGFIRSLSIAKKINYGYSLAIGIALLGTTVGLSIADYYQKQAEAQRTIAYEQQALLSDLEKAVLEVRSHPQRLVSVLGNSIWFNYETSKFFADVNRVKTLLEELENFIASHPNNLAENANSFKDLLSAYTTTTQSYKQLTESLWKRIDPPSLKPEEIPRSQQVILASTREERGIQIGINFERLSEKLTRIVATAKTQQMQAKEQLNSAEILRFQIIVTSMLLSAFIAIALGFYTSRAIAVPIKWISQVAQQITQQSNFKLIIPVLTTDEVGSLATSLNQLVQWVEEYTHELECARQTLEERVEERTQELTHALQELQRTQIQLIQSEKMSSLGQLVAGIAHEINNPVNFIYGNVEHAKHYIQDLLKLVNVYQQEYPPTPAIQKTIEAIELDFLAEDLLRLLSSMKMGTERIQQIVLSLRNFSRLDESEMKPVDISEGIDNSLLILQSRLNNQNISIIKNYQALPLIECYPAQLNQVFMNIISNAIDALEEKNKNDKIEPNEELFSKPSSEDFNSTIRICIEVIDADRLYVRIWNNGPAIPPEIRSKLFDPFFTTKPVGKGTGLGLAICYQIMEKHGGKIEITSDLETGTEFAIALPISNQNSQFL